MTNPHSSLSVEELKELSLRGIRIGVTRGHYLERLSKHKITLYDEAIRVLKQLGAEVVDEIDIPSAKEKWGFEIFTYEFKPDLHAYLKDTASTNEIRSLADVIAFNDEHPEETLKYGQTLLKAAEKLSGTLVEEEYIRTLEKDLYLSRERGIDYALQSNQLDAIVFAGDRGSVIAARAGYPSVIVPAGFIPNGEPFGIMFTGTAFSEKTLLNIAYAFEQATNHRKAPKLLK
ncbi:amidase family protein [Bacillus sp. N9]